ncbi:MAG: LysR family transcriptional regulator, partial [Clostridia bacterium]|nr:LysR family transcriptional regulator [Clostridia bacterium]
MRIEQLVCFQQVVQCRSFTKAANALYTTQPSVSKMIDALEEELGKQLFLRTSRGIKLTAFGSTVYRDVRVILSLIDGWQNYGEADEAVQEVHLQ